MNNRLIKWVAMLGLAVQVTVVATNGIEHLPNPNDRATLATVAILGLIFMALVALVLEYFSDQYVDEPDDDDE